LNCKMLHELTIEILRKYDFHFNPEDIKQFVSIFTDKYNNVYEELLKTYGTGNPHSGMTGIEYTLAHLGEDIEPKGA